MGETRWQSEIKSLKQGARKLYETGELSDITFTMKGEIEFKAHKLLLAARSTEFQRILLDPNVPNPIFIENESVTVTGFKLLLCFIYTDDIGTEEKVPIIEAFIAAECYQQRALQDLCMRKINSWTITRNDVWKLLNAGLSVPVLKDKCLTFIRNNSTEIISYPFFLDISFDCLNAILDSGVLKSVPTLQRLNKIMEWAAIRYTNYECVRHEFENNGILGKLGFEALKLEELRSIVKRYKGLIKPEEVVQFMVYSEDKDVSSLPPWCIPLS